MAVFRCKRCSFVTTNELMFKNHLKNNYCGSRDDSPRSFDVNDSFSVPIIFDSDSGSGGGGSNDNFGGGGDFGGGGSSGSWD